MKECERLNRELGYQPNEEELCRLALLGLGVVAPLLRRIGARDAKPVEASFDPEAPRLLLKAEAPGYRVSVDVAPDGVEETVEVPGLPRGLDEDSAEDSAAEVIEEWGEAEGVEEYDVDYDSGEGLLVVTLRARLAEDLPPLDVLVDRVRQRLTAMGTANASEPRGGDDALDHRQAS
ncbi:MAG: hypothetical protein GXO09_04765 [Crenarchaeota archaeon]|nr:hypothetical protein [Thermoproteota archaeon]